MTSANLHYCLIFFHCGTYFNYFHDKWAQEEQSSNRIGSTHLRQLKYYFGNSIVIHEHWTTFVTFKSSAWPYWHSQHQSHLIIYIIIISILSYCVMIQCTCDITWSDVAANSYRLGWLCQETTHCWTLFALMSRNGLNWTHNCIWQWHNHSQWWLSRDQWSSHTCRSSPCLCLNFETHSNINFNSYFWITFSVHVLVFQNLKARIQLI